MSKQASEFDDPDLRLYIDICRLRFKDEHGEYAHLAISARSKTIFCIIFLHALKDDRDCRCSTTCLRIEIFKAAYMVAPRDT